MYWYFCTRVQSVVWDAYDYLTSKISAIVFLTSPGADIIFIIIDYNIIVKRKPSLEK